MQQQAYLDALWGWPASFIHPDISSYNKYIIINRLLSFYIAL
jgi:hypothetical protein